MPERYLESLKWFLKKGYDLYVVGGAVKDRLLGRPVTDIDILVPPPCADVASVFAGKWGGTRFSLGEKPREKTERVVIKTTAGHLVFDFSGMRGASVEEDLGRRDFTINAMALAMKDFMDRRFDHLLDPFQGREDICKRRIRAVSDDAFTEDPLRLLRAFRFSAELDYEIESATLAAMMRHRDLLRGVSGERIRDELFRILSVSDAAGPIRHMDEMRLLEVVFPEFPAMKGVEQDRFHFLDVWQHSLLALEKVEKVFQEPGRYFASHAGEFSRYLADGFVPGRKKKALIKLVSLFHDVGKPEKLTRDREGRIHFYGHASAGSILMEKAARRLRLSNDEIRFLVGLVERHMALIHLSSLDSVSRKSITRFFVRSGRDFWAHFLLFFGDSLATFGPRMTDEGMDKMIGMAEAMIEIYFREIRPLMEKPRLLTGGELIAQFGLGPGPAIGQILRRLEEARLEGGIRDRDQAIEYVRTLLEEEAVSNSFGGM